MVSKTLPGYIERGGEQVLCQPYKLTGTQLRGFVLPSDPAALRQVCDRYLNAVSQDGTEYHPLLPYSILTFVQMPSIQSADPEERDRGILFENEADIWLLLVAGKRHAGVFVAERLVWYMPYLWVDNPIAMVEGREVYGFPKEFGQFTLPLTTHDPAYFSAETFVVDRFATDSRWKLERLIEVRRTDHPHWGEHATEWREAAHMFQGLFDTLEVSLEAISLPGPGLIADLWHQFRNHQQSLVFLKQFRDVAESRKACYQSLVEAPVTLENFQGGGFLSGDYDVTIHPYASHPLAQELGLGTGPIRASLAYWANFDFTFELGRQVGRG